MLRPNALACSGDIHGEEHSGQTSGKSARIGRSETVAKLRVGFGRQSVREGRQSERGSNRKSEGAERRVKREHSERIAEKPVEYVALALPATEKPLENGQAQKTGSGWWRRVGSAHSRPENTRARPSSETFERTTSHRRAHTNLQPPQTQTGSGHDELHTRRAEPSAQPQSPSGTYVDLTFPQRWDRNSSNSPLFSALLIYTILFSVHHFLAISLYSMSLLFFISSGKLLKFHTGNQNTWAFLTVGHWIYWSALCTVINQKFISLNFIKTIEPTKTLRNLIEKFTKLLINL